MPIYEYKCHECGEKSEFRITSQSQVGELTCKSCGSRDLKKLFSVPVIATGRSSSSEGSCCGQPGSCSAPGSCCGHQN
jgi:putative FmdB family regulatory protein